MDDSRLLQPFIPPKRVRRSYTDRMRTQEFDEVQSDEIREEKLIVLEREFLARVLRPYITLSKRCYEWTTSKKHGPFKTQKELAKCLKVTEQQLSRAYKTQTPLRGKTCFIIRNEALPRVLKCTNTVNISGLPVTD